MRATILIIMLAMMTMVSATEWTDSFDVDMGNWTTSNWAITDGYAHTTVDSGYAYQNFSSQYGLDFSGNFDIEINDYTVPNYILSYSGLLLTKQDTWEGQTDYIWMTWNTDTGDTGTNDDLRIVCGGECSCVPNLQLDNTEEAYYNVEIAFDGNAIMMNRNDSELGNRAVAVWVTGCNYSQYNTMLFIREGGQKMFDFYINDNQVPGDTTNPVIDACIQANTVPDCNMMTTLECNVTDNVGIDSVWMLIDGTRQDEYVYDIFTDNVSRYFAYMMGSNDYLVQHDLQMVANDTSGNLAYSSVHQYTEMCQTCAPLWSCITWGRCNNGGKACTTVEDRNDCGETYTGNYSEFARTCSESGTSKAVTYCTSEGQCFSSIQEYESRKKPTFFAGGNLETSNPFKRFWNWLMSAIWPGEAFP